METRQWVKGQTNIDLDVKMGSVDVSQQGRSSEKTQVYGNRDEGDRESVGGSSDESVVITIDPRQTEKQIRQENKRKMQADTVQRSLYLF